MKKLIYSASALILLATLFSCQKEEVKPIEQEKSSNENFEESYTQEDVDLILADAGVIIDKAAANPIILTVPGKWDGNFDKIGCLNTNGVCLIEVIRLPFGVDDGKGGDDITGAPGTIVLPRERGKAEKINGRITGLPTEVLDNQGNVIKRKYPYERFE